MTAISPKRPPGQPSGLDQAARPSATPPVRVMVADDSAVVRRVLQQWFEEQSDCRLVAACANGRELLDALEEADPEVVILDIEMPEMNGLEALPEIVRRRPDVRVVMASTLTLRNAEISLRALSLGASDYLAKPAGLGGGMALEEFRRVLFEKVRGLAHAARLRRRVGGLADAAATPREAPTISLRPASKAPVRVVGIGSSTGGPEALVALLTPLVHTLPVPFLIAQHIPPMFSAVLAGHIARRCNVEAEEARDGMVVHPGRVYLAPGDRHMSVVENAGCLKISLSDGPPENFCRPSVDPLFRSLAHIFGAEALVAVLTGMGSDGREGARAIRTAGGTVLAQDEASSVVWGMPGAVATAGLCSRVAPVPDLARDIVSLYRAGADGVGARKPLPAAASRAPLPAVSGGTS